MFNIINKMKKEFIIILLLACLGVWVYKRTLESVAVISVVGMYFVSGVDKLNIRNAVLGGDDTGRLKKKYKDTDLSGFVNKYAGILVFVGGLVELLASIGLIYGYFMNKRFMKRVSIISLVVFTILATIMFYANPILGYKALPTISNINAIGGLLSLF
tara:strand:- start:152 stop:625 length:474 start_codon:yes stop_codon:yes gene_type:complete